MNLRAFARMAWNDVELAAHEVQAVLDYAERLVASRPAILDIASLVGVTAPAKTFLGGIELATEEIEKISVLARTLAEKHPAPEPKTPAPDPAAV